MIYNHLKNKTFLLLFATLFSFSLTAAPSPEAGNTLFKNYCAQCHAKDMKTAATGPALSNALADWEEYGQEELYAWIRNSQQSIADGQPRAVELWAQYKPVVMTPMPNLTDEDIASILLFVQAKVDGTWGAPGGGVVVDAGGGTEKANNGWMYWLLLALLGALALILVRIVGGMSQIAAEKGGALYTPKTIMQTLTSKGVVGFALFALIIFGGYTTVNNAVDLGRQQGYAPEQPIKFSHETHAGINKIDCQYCHDGARRSKHAVIPAANTCMNCHRAIKVGSEHGTAEISKIYASIGYDPSTNTYIENYDTKSDDEIKEIYTKWMADSYKAEAGIDDLDREGKKVVEDQWEHLVESLTNEQKKTIQGPIEWTRVHNLPDHVYFNHSQHVTVGKLECQQCHGKVEEMELLEQESPLSMGWCINCHRQTEVKFASNDYYKSYVKFHNEIEDGTKDKVTVSDIGGLECQKCHY